MTADYVSYIESHGAGTLVGDALEVAALSRAFKHYTDKKQYCPLGSVKPNIGHLDVSAGMASMIKAILSLYYKQIPPTINYVNPNPDINFSDSPFYVNDKLSSWQSNVPRIAGVLATGIGGTNSFIVVNEHVDQIESSQKVQTSQLFLLSGKTGNAVKDSALSYIKYIKREIHADLNKMAFTSQIGRQEFDFRCSLVVDSITALSEKLTEISLRENIPCCRNDSSHLIFVFPERLNMKISSVKEFAYTYLENNESISIINDCLTVISAFDNLNKLRKSAYLTIVIECVLAIYFKSISNNESLIYAGIGAGEISAAFANGIISLEQICNYISADWRAGILNSIAVSGSVALTKIYSSLLKKWTKSADIIKKEYLEQLFYNNAVYDRDSVKIADDDIILDSLARFKQSDGSLEEMLNVMIGPLWENGVNIIWEKFCKDTDHRRTSMPGYAFQKQQYWLSEVPINFQPS